MLQRYYDPVIGRFYSNDPVGFTASNQMMFNRYAYANNNPYKYNDPDGRTAESLFVPGKQYETQMQAVSNAWGDLKASLDTSAYNSTSPYPSSGTVEYGLAATLSGGASGTGSVTVAFDSHKNSAVNLTLGGGGGTPGVSVEAIRSTTTADNVADLKGFGGVTTISGGDGVGGSLSSVAGAGYTGQTIGIGFTAGPLPGGASAHVTRTWQIPLKKGK